MPIDFQRGELPIDFEHEQLLSAVEAAREYPRKVSVDTVYRHMYSGIRGGHRLESIMVAGRRYTTREAIRRFLRRCQETKQDGGPGRPKKEAATQDERELIADGA